MEYRRLGKSGLQVSTLSLGSWLTFGLQISDEIAESLMVYAYEQGVNFFDNAEIYANGRSEIVMGNILKKVNWERSSYVVSSKVFFGDGGQKPNQKGLSRKHIFEACDAALKRFQLDYVDLFFCHRADPNTPIEETVRAMNHLIAQGKIMYWGTSEWSVNEILEADRIATALGLIGPSMEQPQYNLFTREKVEKEFLPAYKEVGIGTTIWSPLASGILSGKYLDADPTDTRLKLESLKWLKEKTLQEENLQKVRELLKIADELGTTLPKLSIAWCVANPHVSTVILGASKLEHLKETLQSLELLPLLKPEIMKRIDAIFPV
ncbi:MAG: voltage-dependent potassium channel subunit beta [Saprospiraceae bacterium]